MITAQGIEDAQLPRIYQNTEVSIDLLSDESKMEGQAEYAALPSSTEEVSAIMKWACRKSIPVTVSAGRTGIAGGAVPSGGLLVSMSRMQKIGELNTDGPEISVSCQSGVLLSDLQAYLIRKKCKSFFAPDPTETSAAIGGMIACNASGAHTFRYGPTRKYVKSITTVLYNGDVIKLERGQASADKDGSFVLKTSEGTELKGTVPSYPQPATKNAAGYFSGPEMDLIDLFIGSEGTLGVITEAEVILIPKPDTEFNAMFFLSDEPTAVELTNTLRNDKKIDVTAIEYFDHAALDLLRERRANMGAASMVPPGLPEHPYTAGIYIDVTASKDDVAESVKHLNSLAESLKTGKSLAVWAAFDRDERERLRKFRHALPETVNTLISERRKTYPEITKLGTDMAVPDEFLSDILNVYREKLDKNNLQYCIFGHIGNNHLHVNILPANPDEYALGKDIYREFAEKVLEMGGSVSAEHGIGKLKRNFLSMMMGDEGIKQMKEVKRVFDPLNMIGTDTLFI